MAILAGVKFTTTAIPTADIHPTTPLFFLTLSLTLISFIPFSLKYLFMLSDPLAIISSGIFSIAFKILNSFSPRFNVPSLKYSISSFSLLFLSFKSKANTLLGIKEIENKLIKRHVIIFLNYS